MTPEEYQRIKEAEKEHLRALKKLKKAVRDFERSKSIANAVTRMGSESESALDTHSEVVDKLALETAHFEARLEVALESAGERAEKALKAEELAKFDDELQKERARDLVDRIRSEVGATDAREPDDDSGTGSGVSPTRGPADERDEGPLPEKTIGRMRGSGNSGEKKSD